MLQPELERREIGKRHTYETYEGMYTCIIESYG